MDIWSIIFYVLLIFQISSGVLTFIILFFVNAPYGIHQSKKWGPSIAPRLGWVLMELPAFVVILFVFLAGLFNLFGEGFANGADGRCPIVLFIFLLIWEIHYFQRTFIYPFTLEKNSKRMAVLIPLMGILFNSINGFINGYYLFSNQTLFFKGTIFEVDTTTLYTIDWFYDPRFIIGIFVFICGMIINIHSDRVLKNLRAPGETGYKIPNKGFHRLVSNPNYLGELMEWSGFAIMTWSLPGLAFALFTFANLGPRAYSKLKWYKKTFGDEYPKNRKAIIPFIF